MPQRDRKIVKSPKLLSSMRWKGEISKWLTIFMYVILSFVSVFALQLYLSLRNERSIFIFIKKYPRISSEKSDICKNDGKIEIF